MRSQIDLLRRQHRFDSVVCDFLAVAPNFPDLENCVLFQHNVETAIWRRHAEHAADPLRRAYLRLQEKRMFAYERRVCRSVAGVLAVSEEDAAAMRSMFGIDHVMAIPTGVDIEYFAPAPSSAPAADLTFIGSMDWLPNIDGMKYFVNEVLPLLRQRRPNCSLAIVGRDPDPEIVALARRDPLVRVTGTVADIRPHLWNAAVSIVPLRIGGGTRLKIYESMAARVPVVSTEVGAEGLQVRHGENIRLAATAEQFASECLDLLDNETERRRQSEAAFRLVDAHFSWDRVVPRFEAALERFCGSAAATCA
jgi:glycosyltransferase involved in cell wall biosynthesis